MEQQLLGIRIAIKNIAVLTVPYTTVLSLGTVTMWKREKDTQSVKVTQGIMSPEARRAVEQRGNTPTLAKSYSDVAGG